MSALADAAATRRPGPSAVSMGGWAMLAVLAIVLLLAPEIFDAYWLSQILTQALWLGIAAVSVTFLYRYGGMVSLAQVAIYGIAGFAMGNVVHTINSEGGLNLGWSPWAGVAFGVAVAVLVGLLFGAIASRSYGIYFLMITLALSLFVFYFFGQVTQLSGFGGIRSVSRPGFVGDPITDPTPLYYTCLACSVGVYLLLRYVVRAPFGVALQGTRDDPGRMRSLGYNVPLHRTLAFTLGAFVAAIAGILSVWFNTQISPGSIDISQTIAVLIIAVIGGLSRLEGAWLGAIAYTLVDYYSRQHTPTLGLWLNPGRFATIIGIVFLGIVLLSPDGLIGIGRRLRELIARTHGGGAAVAVRPDGAQAEQQAGVPAGTAPPASGTREA
ncbi:MAG: branched-chain amino acid ABC transporter permease [Solirubrobacterales bacterium]|nr:branched-chain amino acid ABC transporter permease [Solirubrobacterales bacterium]